MIGEESHLKESPPTHEIVTDTTSLCRLKTSDSQSRGFPQQQHDVVSVLEKKENRVRRDSSLQRYMESFSAEDAVICILCGVRSACGGEIREKGSAKGKEIREDGVEEAEGIENRAVVDGVFRTSR